MKGKGLFLIACALAGCAAPGERRAPTTVPVGLARVDITPDYPVRLTGYGGRRAESAGVEQRLWAKALAIGEEPAVIVTVDNCAVPAWMVEKVAARISVRRERFVVCSTHTHTGPCLNGALPLMFGAPIPEPHQKHIDRYTRELEEALVALVEKALADRRPGRLSRAEGTVTFASNRRVVQSGRWTGFGNAAGGPVDHSLPLVKITGDDGTLRGILVNYACHCTTLGGNANRICGDWAGYAQEYMEEDHPGAVAMVAIGCGADANPRPRGTFAHARQNGRAISDEVKRLLDATTPLDPAIRAQLKRIKLPFADLPTREQWEQRAKGGGAGGYQARLNLERLKRGENLPGELDYPIAVWTFGDDLAMVFLAGEVVVDYALRLKSEFDAARLWITAYANDVPCYIPSKRILREGGYEADGSMIYYDRPTRFAPEVEDRIMGALETMLPDTFRFPRPKSPKESRATIRTVPGVEVELVAAEPLVVDPVAFDWGPDGRLWVVEMRDYPTGVRGGGRIKVLTDDDGDGRYDRATVFIDGLSYPTGVKVWREGVLITAAPEILYAEDTDGDGRADKKRRLYMGFGIGNQQHRVNGLRWRLDNWLQVGNGDSGGIIQSVKTGVRVSVRGRDLRIEPDSGGLDAQSGQTQFGTDRDDWGNWFGGNNSVAIWHYVLADHYLRRNPHTRHPDPKNVLVGSARVFPISRTLLRFNDPNMADRITSASSPTIYRDELFDPRDWFVCESVHNLVTRGRLTPAGVTFTTARVEEESEFLAATDHWFRPVMIRTGPDGALWIADMYRFVIEHPRWIPKDRRERQHLRDGDDRGRIYRVYPGKPRPMPRLDRLDTAGLVAALDSPNGWVRDMVQQMLIWRGDAEAVAPLEKVVREAERPQARLHALCTLDGLKALRTDIVRHALEDAHPGVRRHAVRLSEWDPALLELVNDPDPHVRLQLAYSLGTWDDPRAGRALAAMDVSDPYMKAAVMSSAPAHVTAMMGTHPEVLAIAVAMNNETVLAEAVRSIKEFKEMAALLDALARRNRSFDKLRAKAGDELRRALDGLTPLFEKARATPNTETIPLLGHQPEHRDVDVKILTGLLGPRAPVDLQVAAVGCLARLRLKETPELLLADWPSRGPTVRRAAIEALLSRREWTEALLEAGRVASLDAAQRSRLLNHRSKKIRKRAKEFLSANTDLQKVIDTFKTGMSGLTGRAAAGRATFEARCSKCHPLGGVGKRVGPDLAALTDRSTSALLTAIVDPNQAVEDKYLEYRATTLDERTVFGMVSSESGAAITLIDSEGKEETVLRSELAELTGTKLSLMPVSLEEGLSPQQMADLIAFVRAGAVPKPFPNNRPEPVRQELDGSLSLPASKAAIYGGDIIFEQRYRNIGYWHGADDHAVWTLEVAQAGTYEVELDWACHDSTAGNRFTIGVGDEDLTDTVPGTGTWDNYSKRVFGRIKLEAGRRRLIFRPAVQPKGALIDLRTIRLIPVK